MMNLSDALFTSDRQDWETPQAFFDAYHERYRFTIDLAALPHNTKLPRFYGPDVDSLKQDWSGERGWPNPPYGRGLDKWIRKCVEAAQKGALIVCIVPARTDTKWWHDYVTPYAHVKFIRGRMRFRIGGVPGDNAPFPVAVLIFGDPLI